MGHIWLGELPRTGYWKHVIATLGISDNPAAIAAITAKAAHQGLELAKRDSGVANTIFILMKSVWSSKENNFQEAMGDIGIKLTSQSGLLDVIGEVDRVLDMKLRKAGHRTDLAEMARYSAVETLTDLCKHQTGSLFDTTIADTQKALSTYATAAKFSEVGKSFFGRFLYRFLDYHVCRETANHIGPGEPHTSLATYSRFKDSLQRHCIETVRIIKEFSGCWPSATEYKEGLTAENIRTKFVPVAFKKIQNELAVR